MGGGGGGGYSLLSSKTSKATFAIEEFFQDRFWREETADRLGRGG